MVISLAQIIPAPMRKEKEMIENIKRKKNIYKVSSDDEGGL